MYILANIFVVGGQVRIKNNVSLLFSTREQAEDEAKKLAINHNIPYTVLEVLDTFGSEKVAVKA